MSKTRPDATTNTIHLQDGPISGDMRQHLQSVSELLGQLPDEAIPPARHSVMALFECLERVKALESAPLALAELNHA